MNSHFNIVHGCLEVSVLLSRSPLPVYVPWVTFTLEPGQSPSCAAFTDLRPDWLNVSEGRREVSCLRVTASLLFEHISSNFHRFVMHIYLWVRGHFTLLFPLSYVLFVWLFLFSNTVTFCDLMQSKLEHFEVYVVWCWVWTDWKKNVIYFHCLYFK